jgi:hypothetical protein
MAQVVQHLPTKHKALTSNPITTKQDCFKVLNNALKTQTCIIHSWL